MNFSSFQSELLSHLGLEHEKDIEVFLNPSYERDIHDPFLLKDMEKAVERIERAIQNTESVYIYGDYDADGIPATVLLFELFKRIGFDAKVYIPHRNREGFGLNTEAAEEIASAGAQLVITVDCGITDVDAACVFKERGVDLIITDHHSPADKLPDAYAIINPKRKDCAYPFKELSGSGVAWKLASALLSRNPHGLKAGWEKWLLGMAAIGTICDMVPLVGENRTIARFGLEVLRILPSPGWKMLLEKARIEQRYLSEDDLGFSVGPRLNAASRMGDPREAFLLLTAPTLIEARRYADSLESLNNQRKGAVASMVKQAKQHIRDGGKEGLAVIVCGDPNWKPSLLGLAAGSLADEMKRPVFLWGREEARELKGSCRSGGKRNVVEIMRSLPEGLLTHCGGHVHAGGFSLETERVFDLEDALIAAYETCADLPQEARNAFRLSASNVDGELLSFFEQLAPFGVGHPRPLIELTGEVQQFERFGSAKEHAKFFVHENGQSLRAIHFRAPRGVIGVSHICIHGVIETSRFAGREEVRLRVTGCDEALYS